MIKENGSCGFMFCWLRFPEILAETMSGTHSGVVSGTNLPAGSYVYVFLFWQFWLNC